MTHEAFSRDAIARAVEDALRQVAPEADTAALPPNQPIRDALDIDSFDFLRFVVGLHERLGVDVPEADYASLATRASAVDYLARRLGTP
jgi:acyl carrier protein